MNNLRRYERAWDLVDKVWKTPEEVDYSIMHEKPRFVSEKPNIMGDGGYILTLCKDAVKTYKGGTSFSVRRHFKKLTKNGLNTYENREKIRKQEIKRESEIHKLCKDLFLQGKISKIHE